MSFSFPRLWLRHHKPLTQEATPDPNNPIEAEAQFRLGLRFASAEGEAQDYPLAAEWYAKAAAQNHALAQFNLSLMYAHGQGIAQDEAKSLVWLTRSAELGDAGAQYKLGVGKHLACRNTSAETLAETRIEALKWVQLSAAQGYRGADRACEFVTLAMTLEEVAEGGYRAATFTAANEVRPGPNDSSAK